MVRVKHEHKKYWTATNSTTTIGMMIGWWWYFLFTTTNIINNSCILVEIPQDSSSWWWLNKHLWARSERDLHFVSCWHNTRWHMPHNGMNGSHIGWQDIIMNCLPSTILPLGQRGMHEFCGFRVYLSLGLFLQWKYHQGRRMLLYCHWLQSSEYTTSSNRVSLLVAYSFKFEVVASWKRDKPGSIFYETRITFFSFEIYQTRINFVLGCHAKFS